MSLRNQLAQNGYLRIARLFEIEDLKVVMEATNNLIQDWKKNVTNDPDFWSYQPPDEPRPILYRIHNLETKHPSIMDLVEHPKLRHYVELLVGKSARPTAFALTIKLENHGLAVPWHRDPVSAPPSTIFNFSIYLDNSNLQNGCLEVVPKSHLVSEDYIPTGQGQPQGAIPIEVAPGDVVVHDVRLLHGSAEVSNAPLRRAIVTEFRPSNY